jgi:hypothetical protein
MQLQSKTRQPLAEHRHYALRIVLPFKSEDAIVRIPHQYSFTAQVRPDFLGEPQIDHVVQIGVTQQWRQRRTLNCTLCRRGELFTIQHPHMQTFANEP